ncbi:MAG: hypothetical protein ACJAVD_000149, partial [Porticoccaceae bacterium]
EEIMQELDFGGILDYLTSNKLLFNI